MDFKSQFPKDMIQACEDAEQGLISDPKQEMSMENKLIKSKLMDLDKRKIVISNEMVLGVQPMSTLEMKLLRVVLSQVQDYSHLHQMSLAEYYNNFPVYTVNIKELTKKIYGNKRKGMSIYRDVEKACISLQTRALFYRKDDGEWTSMSWTSFAHYKNGKVDIKLNPDMNIFVKNLTSNFSIFSLDEVLSFRGKYSLRIYEAIYAKIHRDMKSKAKWKKGFDIEVKFSIEELHIYTATLTKYDHVGKFRTKVIEPAVKEINEVSNVGIRTFEMTKSGRKIDGVTFICYNKVTDEPVFVEPKAFNQVFDPEETLSASYVMKVLDDFEVGYKMPEVMLLVKTYDGDIDLFHKNLIIALPKAKANLVNYMIAMVKNKETDVDLNKKKHIYIDDWDTPELKADFQELVDYWNDIAYSALVHGMLPDEEHPDNAWLRPITHTDKRSRRHYYQLLEEGETLDSVKRAVDVAKNSAYFLRISGTFIYFINPKNYFAIAEGERNYDSEAEKIVRIGRE